MTQHFTEDVWHKVCFCREMEMIKVTARYASRNEEIVAGLREAAGAGPPVDPEMKIKRLIAEAAATMALLHGGDFRVQIDHEDCLIVVARRRIPRQQTP